MEQKYGKSLHMLKLWCQLLLISVAPNLSASGTGFVEDNFSTDQGGGGGRDGLGMIQAHYIYYALSVIIML